jgi:hypothetical protein
MQEPSSSMKRPESEQLLSNTDDAAIGDRGKHTFKDKFHCMMQAAHEAQAEAVHQQELQDRKSLSIAMLVQGKPQAFVDFFMLTQLQQQPVTAAVTTDADQHINEGAFGSAADIQTLELSLQTMMLLQEQLMLADTAIRQGSYAQAFNAHRAMANHFTQLEILHKAIFFWRKCLKVGTQHRT